MALTRSQSGPPMGLSINTGAANSVGGATTLQPPPAGGIFGSSSTTNSQAPAQATTTAPGGASLFGGGGGTTTSTTGGTGGMSSLFGNSTLGGGSGGSIFGGAGQNTSQPQQQQQQQPSFQSASPFGGQQQQANQGSSLFGGQQQQQPNQGSSLFGAAPAQNQQTSGLFGGQQQQGTQGATMFGQPQQQQQVQAGSSLFGGAPVQQGQTGSIFGQSNATQQQQQQPQQVQVVPGIQVDLSQVKGSTKYDDMTAEARNFIGQIDEAIQKVFKWRNEIIAYTPVHEEEIKQLSRDVQYLEKKYELVKRAVLEGDVASVQELRTMTNQNNKDFQTVQLAVDNLKLPAQYHLPGLWSTTSGAQTSFGGGDPSQTDLIDYFSRQVTLLTERDTQLRSYLDEIQQHMPNVENGLYQKLTMLQNTFGLGSAHSSQLDDIKETLLETRSAIVAKAVQVGKLHEQLSKLKVQFYQPL